ncbi:serine O-acetyltransferase [Flavobacterium degerlachei]|jgi:serine O-acetyltransferase|nr:serine acetyltransferase [Flavobacterium degerlachei]
MTVFKLIQSDYCKYKKYGGHFFAIVFLSQGFWAIFQYRIANGIYRKIRIPIVRHILLLFCLFWQKIVEITTGISIPASVQIGHSFYIGHFGGIILNGNAVIGNNCNISQGVTIGISGIENKRGVPVIGNDVYIGANAVLAGKIRVGNSVLIGACSMVNSSIADNAVVMGVPAVVISNHGSKGYI